MKAKKSKANIIQLKKEHEEKWVAMNKTMNKVIAYSEHLSDLREKMGRDNMEIVYMRVPRSDTVYVL